VMNMSQPGPAAGPELEQERHQLLAEVASLYYDANYTQSEIADELGVSRSSISRLLSLARELGVVDITINWPGDSISDLGPRIKQQFGIHEIRVVRAGARGQEQVVEALGGVAARLLEKKLRDNMVIGIAWNTGVYQVIRALRAAYRMGGTVVQLTGSAGVNPRLDGPDLARWLAQILGGQYLYLSAPLVVDSPATRAALLKDRAIAERLEYARRADLALVGIGTVYPPLCSLLEIGYLTEAELAAITVKGGVGDILTTFYDIEGRILSLPFHERIIGLPLTHLHEIGCVIGVAAGREKAPAIIGALRGGFINCLVIDDQAARAVLQLSAGSAS
jgi:deoxyribonucleoside regulator